MHQQSNVKYLSQFVVCESESCYQSVNICHKSYFKEMHFDVVNNKKTTHKSIAFDQSLQYINFYHIAKIENVIAKKISATLKGFNTDIDGIVHAAICKSQIFLQIFNNNLQTIGQYLYLRNIQKGVEMGMVYAFSQNLCTSLLTNQDKRVSKCYKQLCRQSAEWQNLNSEFNLASGINSAQLQNFIQKQVIYFSQYCQQLAEQKKEFSINNYVSLRNTSPNYQNDPYYFNSQFTNFLTSKYERSPEKQQIFNVVEYYLHFWEYFYVIIDVSKNVFKYFEEQIGFYKEYEAIMGQVGLNQSFLSFRMWRLNRKVSTYKPSLRNPFFHQSFIYSFIQELIYKKIFYPEEKRSYDFKEFAKYIKDYIKFITDNQSQVFSFSRYREYFDFRRKNQNFQESLKTNKQVIYSKKYYLQYLHTEFIQNNRVALKKYKKYQETERQKQDEKIQHFKEVCEHLKQALLQQQKKHFYEILFINYVNMIQQNSELPSKETYFLYKQQILQNFDETYLQEQEANYKLALVQLSQPSQEGEQAQQRKEKKEKKQKKQNQIIKEEINEIEEKIAEIIEKQNVSQASSQEEQDNEPQTVICPCCKGRPYDCGEKQCIMMGCCTACMFD